MAMLGYSKPGGAPGLTEQPYQRRLPGRWAEPHQQGRLVAWAVRGLADLERRLLAVPAGMATALLLHMAVAVALPVLAGSDVLGVTETRRRPALTLMVAAGALGAHPAVQV